MRDIALKTRPSLCASLKIDISQMMLPSNQVMRWYGTLKHALSKSTLSEILDMYLYFIQGRIPNMYFVICMFRYFIEFALRLKFWYRIPGSLSACKRRVNKHIHICRSWISNIFGLFAHPRNTRINMERWYVRDETGSPETKLHLKPRKRGQNTLQFSLAILGIPHACVCVHISLPLGFRSIYNAIRA